MINPPGVQSLHTAEQKKKDTHKSKGNYYRCWVKSFGKLQVIQAIKNVIIADVWFIKWEINCTWKMFSLQINKIHIRLVLLKRKKDYWPFFSFRLFAIKHKLSSSAALQPELYLLNFQTNESQQQSYLASFRLFWEIRKSADKEKKMPQGKTNKNWDAWVNSSTLTNL